MSDLLVVGLCIAIASPLALALILGVIALAGSAWPKERQVYALCSGGLLASLLGSATVLAVSLGSATTLPAEVDLGHWVRIGNYEIDAVLLLDPVALTFSLLGGSLTLLVARFSQTYLHKEAGFARFYLLLGVFATGTQLVAYAGSLDVLFAGWEAIGISSALFIGFFHERDEPVRSAVRAYATYRVCDTGFLIAVVGIHELVGSTKLADLAQVEALPSPVVTLLALMLMVAAFGKSAQLPFSSWLPRAMEGPTPSSALFYGAVSIHAGLFLLLRAEPLLQAAPVARVVGVVIGVSTSLYAAAIARTHTDAKGTLAHATLAQTGLILAEICLGFTTLALVHLASHAVLRAWQYLRAPNLLHDAHGFGHGGSHPVDWLDRIFPAFTAWLYPRALHRFRLDDRIDAAVAPVLWVARKLSGADDLFRAWTSRRRGPSG